MVEVKITLTLPDQLAQAAQDAGLLSPDAIQALLGEAVRQRKSEALFAAADRLAALDLPPLSAAEVEAEIQAARKERRTSARRR